MFQNLLSFFVWRTSVKSTNHYLNLSFFDKLQFNNVNLILGKLIVFIDENNLILPSDVDLFLGRHDVNFWHHDVNFAALLTSNLCFEGFVGFLFLFFFLLLGTQNIIYFVLKVHSKDFYWMKFINKWHVFCYGSVYSIKWVSLFLIFSLNWHN